MESNPTTARRANRSPRRRPPSLLSPPRGGCCHVRAPGVPNVEGKILRPATVRLEALGSSQHGREDTIQPLLSDARRCGAAAAKVPHAPAANQRRELEISGYRGP